VRREEPVSWDDYTHRGSVWGGIALTFLLHLLQILIVMFAPSGNLFIFPNMLFSPFLIGLNQLVYLLPALALAYKLNYPKTAQGLIIGGTLTFLLNAGCWGLIAGPTLFRMG
jgi:hypothetical protein